MYKFKCKKTGNVYNWTMNEILRFVNQGEQYFHEGNFYEAFLTGSLKLLLTPNQKAVIELREKDIEAYEENGNVRIEVSEFTSVEISRFEVKFQASCFDERMKELRTELLEA